MPETQGYEPVVDPGDAEKLAPQKNSSGKPINKEGEVVGGREFNEKLGIWITPVSEEETKAFDESIRPITHPKDERTLAKKSDPEAKKPAPSATKSKRDELIRKHEELNRGEDRDYLGIRKD